MIGAKFVQIFVVCAIFGSILNPANRLANCQLPTGNFNFNPNPQIPAQPMNFPQQNFPAQNFPQQPQQRNQFELPGQSRNPTSSRDAFQSFMFPPPGQSPQGRTPGQFQNREFFGQQGHRNSMEFDYSRVDRRHEEGWHHLYKFGEMYDDVDLSDRQWKDVQIDLDFFLPFYGFRFNYTFIFHQGFIAFSYPNYIQPPYELPTPEWPKKPDPSAIAAFMMEQQFMSVGQYRISNLWCRIITRPISSINVMQNFDGFLTGQSSQTFYDYSNAKKTADGRVEDPAFLDEVTRDIQASMVGSRGFRADYALLVTWERMGYGGAPKITDISQFQAAKRWQNTYQMLVATDEIRTYTIFNYANINWTSSTQAGSLAGRGGKQSALVGFNGGNGTGWTAMPWSAEGNSYKLVQYGSANVAGRWLARVDEQVEIGGCSNASKGMLYVDKPLASMLGGFVLNVTAACFRESDVLKLQIDEITLDCTRTSMVMARCVVPVAKIFKTGMVDVKLSVDGGITYPWTNKFYILTPSLAHHDVNLIDSARSTIDKWHNYNAENLTLKWPAANLTSNFNARVDIRLWGYWEDALEFNFAEVGSIALNVPNSGVYTFMPKTMDKSHMFLDAWRSISGGVVQVRVSDDRLEDNGDGIHWSKLVSFGWYFRDVWQNEYGQNWAFDHCIEWYLYDGRRENFYGYLETEVACPCTLNQARIDVGRFVSLTDCDMNGNHDCYYHKGAKHCVLSTVSVWTGAAQVCCYDWQGWLMFSHDYEYNNQQLEFYSAGVPYRAHPWGSHTFKRPPYVPSLSNFFNDLMPYDTCCKWAGHCEFYYWRRITSGCQDYKPPAVGYVYGLGHFITFDDSRYQFLGKGLYTLVSRKIGRHETQVQIRMETPTKNILNREVSATIVTGLSAKDNDSSKVEIYARKDFSHWRYTTDVYVDGHRIFFDTSHQKLQHFRGVAIRSHPLNMNMSELEVMFSTGMGLLVKEARGSLNVMVSIPPNYKESLNFSNENYAFNRPLVTSPMKCSSHIRTMGLLGPWNDYKDDDFTTPDCRILKFGSDSSRSDTDFYQLHVDFGEKWKIDGRSTGSLFEPKFKAINNPLTYASPYYRPVNNPMQEMNNSLLSFAAFSIEDVKATCQGSRACIFDFLTMGKREYGLDTLDAERKFLGLKYDGQRTLISCGPLQKHERVIKYPPQDNYLHGTTVRFTCQPDYFLHGTEQRTCVNGTWTPGWWAWCRWRDEEHALKWFTGIIISLLIIATITAIFCYCMRIRKKRLQTMSKQNRFSHMHPTLTLPNQKGAKKGQKGQQKAHVKVSHAPPTKHSPVFPVFEGDMHQSTSKGSNSSSASISQRATPSPLKLVENQNHQRIKFMETAA